MNSRDQFRNSGVCPLCIRLLKRILEIRHWKSYCLPGLAGPGWRHLDELEEVGNEIARRMCQVCEV